MSTTEQSRLERSACLKLALFETLSCLIFVFHPNPASFSRLAASGLAIVPEILGVLNALGALVYLWLGLHPSSARYSSDVRSIIFFCASIPLMIYLVPLGGIIITLGMSVVGFVYLLIWLILVLLIRVIYHGYSRQIEVVSLVSLAAFMFICAYTFSSTTSSLPKAIPFPALPLVILALGGGISYLLMITPLFDMVSYNLRRLWFMLSEAVLPIYATIILVNALFFNSSIFPPVSLFDLYLLIALLAYPLIRGRYASSVAIH